MPPTTRSMAGRGVETPQNYAHRQPRPRAAAPAVPRYHPYANKTLHGKKGFHRQELQAAGALESRAAAAPSLRNEIHELFSKDKFVFEDPALPPAGWDEAYEIMKPAFRLATRWITYPYFQKFWNCLGRGSIELLELMEVRTVETVVEANDLKIQLHYPEGERPDEDGEDVPACFRQYATQHHFQFRRLQNAWAETRSQSVHDHDGPPGENFASMTGLHSDFLTVCSTTFPTATLSEQIRFLYFLAVNLTHELAHLMWQHRAAKRSAKDFVSSVLDKEPWFFDMKDPHNELGIAWECYMFGGRIQPLNHVPSPFVPDGLAIMKLAMVQDNVFWDADSDIAPLLTDWINRQFSETWWQRKGPRAVMARRPGHPGRARARASVNRTTDSDVFRNDTYEQPENAQYVEDFVKGGCPGHRVVRSMDDTFVSTGVLQHSWSEDQG